MGMLHGRKLGFTLVELLIVVIIIGILAAVAIPQFSDSATDAKSAALDSDLAAMRNAIELYYHQHTSKYPGIIKTHKVGAGAAVAHTNVEQAFAYQLTMFSDAFGNTADTKDAAAFPYGPYLKRGIPTNPLPAAGALGAPASVSVGTDTGPLSADGTPTTGWKFSSATGQLIANNTPYAGR
jgi:prepilin-type N-terminal cleavage/methylation domain-containing protein